MAKETVLRFGPINKSQQKIQLEYGGGIGYLDHTKESLKKLPRSGLVLQTVMGEVLWH